MNHNYPHLADTEFPDLASTNVYKYENTYDYDKYKGTINIKMMNVSWCGDYENTVYFETKELRDKWFREQKGLVRELSTMFRLYSDGTLKVDVPIDEAMDYNYAMIDYGKLPNQNALSDNHIMYYFISDMRQASVDATELTLSLDYWTTFINDMDITYVNLVRGHAPMAETTVEEYLSNPIENSEYLLTDDVSYGDFQRVTSTEPIVLNDSDVVLGFLTNGDLSKSWTDQVAVTPYYIGSQSLSAIDIWIIDTYDFEGFRDAVDVQCPQFWTTVKGMFLIPRKLLNITTSHQFCGYTVHHTDTNSDKTITAYNITKGKFGYASNIASIAKLYTYPYAAIEVNDFKGNTSLIKIEDTVGSLELHTIMCDMYPFLNIEAYMLGLGGSKRSVVNFQNVYDNTLHIGGRFYDFSTKWSIPVFAVQLTVEDNWALHREIGANIQNTLTKMQADVSVENNALQISCNNANTTEANAQAAENTAIDNKLSGQSTANSNLLTSQNATSTANSDIQQASISAGALVKTAGVSASATTNTAYVGAAAGVISGAVEGAMVGGLAGAAAGAFGNAVSAAPNMINANINASATTTNASINAGATMANAAVGAALTQVNSANTQTYNTNQNSNAIGANNSRLTVTQDYNNAINTNNNALSAATTKNSSDLAYSMADLILNASKEQVFLNNPPQYGQLTGTPDIISKPLGYTYNIVTQSKNAIRQAAEQFLRYGYMLNMQWNIGTYNLMPKFTYWKCDEVYCNDNGVFEGAQDMIKSILNRGTTVWNDPSEIGLVSIYQNGVNNG